MSLCAGTPWRIPKIPRQLGSPGDARNSDGMDSPRNGRPVGFWVFPAKSASAGYRASPGVFYGECISRKWPHLEAPPGKPQRNAMRDTSAEFPGKCGMGHPVNFGDAPGSAGLRGRWRGGGGGATGGLPDPGGFAGIHRVPFPAKSTRRCAPGNARNPPRNLDGHPNFLSLCACVCVFG